MALLATGMQFIGGMKQAAAIKAAGKAQMQEAEYRAAQGRVLAGQERASAQRSMIEENRKTRIAQSRALAVSAAQGSSSDPSVLNIMAGLESEGRYGALTALYQGEDRAAQLESGANLALYEGQNALRAAKTESKLKQFETVGKTAASLFDIYGPKGSSSGETWSSGERFRTR